jgi:hypothetical protein
MEIYDLEIDHDGFLKNHQLLAINCHLSENLGSHGGDDANGYLLG